MNIDDTTKEIVQQIMGSKRVEDYYGLLVSDIRNLLSLRLIKSQERMITALAMEGGAKLCYETDETLSKLNYTYLTELPLTKSEKFQVHYTKQGNNLFLLSWNMNFQQSIENNLSHGNPPREEFYLCGLANEIDQEIKRISSVSVVRDSTTHSSSIRQYNREFSYFFKVTNNDIQ